VSCLPKVSESGKDMADIIEMPFPLLAIVCDQEVKGAPVPLDGGKCTSICRERQATEKIFLFPGNEGSRRPGECKARTEEEMK
jgi:hypothetical protein